MSVSDGPLRNKRHFTTPLLHWRPSATSWLDERRIANDLRSWRFLLSGAFLLGEFLCLLERLLSLLLHRVVLVCIRFKLCAGFLLAVAVRVIVAAGFAVFVLV